MKKVMNLLLLVFAGIFLIGFGSAWEDNGSLYQEVDGCGNLITANAVYNLIGNVSSNGTCFTISSNNITLNGQNFLINYSQNGSVGNAIFSVNSSNLFIKNITAIVGNDSSDISSPSIYFLNISNSVVRDFSLFTFGKNSHCIFLVNSSNNSFFQGRCEMRKSTLGSVPVGIFLKDNSLNNLFEQFFFQVSARSRLFNISSQNNTLKDININYSVGGFLLGSYLFEGSNYTRLINIYSNNSLSIITGNNTHNIYFESTNLERIELYSVSNFTFINSTILSFYNYHFNVYGELNFINSIITLSSNLDYSFNSPSIVFNSTFNGDGGMSKNVLFNKVTLPSLCVFNTVVYFFNISNYSLSDVNFFNLPVYVSNSTNFSLNNINLSGLYLINVNNSFLINNSLRSVSFISSNNNTFSSNNFRTSVNLYGVDSLVSTSVINLESSSNNNISDNFFPEHFPPTTFYKLSFSNNNYFNGNISVGKEDLFSSLSSSNNNYLHGVSLNIGLADYFINLTNSSNNTFVNFEVNKSRKFINSLNSTDNKIVNSSFVGNYQNSLFSELNIKRLFNSSENVSFIFNKTEFGENLSFVVNVYPKIPYDYDYKDGLFYLNFIPTKQGVYTFTLEANNSDGSIEIKNYLFLYGNTSEKTSVKYYMHNDAGTHGQSNPLAGTISDIGSMYTYPVISEEERHCGRWVQYHPDEIVNHYFFIKDVVTGWYYSAVGTNLVVALEEFSRYYFSNDYSTIVLPTNGYEWRQANITNINYALDYLDRIYFLGLKMGGDSLDQPANNPSLKSTTTYQSYTQFVYLTVGADILELKPHIGSDASKMNLLSNVWNDNEKANTSLQFEGEGNLDITLNISNLYDKNYTIAYDGIDCFSNPQCTINSNINGTINLTLSLGSLHQLDIYEYVSILDTTEVISGGGSSGPLSYSVSESSLQNGFTRNMRKSDSLKFSVNNESHNLTVSEINNKTITIIVRSEPQTFNINLNGSVNVDLNKDGIYDLEISYLKYFTTLVSLKIKTISLAYELPKVVEEEKEETKAPFGLDEEILEGSALNKYIFWSIFGVVVIVIIGLVILFVRKIFLSAKKEIGKKNSSKDK